MIKECEDDRWVEEGIECPSLNPGICIFMLSEIGDEICFEEDHSECYYSSEDSEYDFEEEWLEGYTCEEEGFTTDCGDETFVEDGVDCP